jgi:hypothetical protein
MKQGAISQLKPAVRPQHHLGQTSRQDLWWAKSSMVFIALSAFVAYSVWAAIQGSDYRWGPYLSPFYSPELFGSTRSWLGRNRVGGPDGFYGRLRFSFCGRRPGSD